MLPVIALGAGGPRFKSGRPDLVSEASTTSQVVGAFLLPFAVSRFLFLAHARRLHDFLRLPSESRNASITDRGRGGDVSLDVSGANPDYAASQRGVHCGFAVKSPSTIPMR